MTEDFQTLLSRRDLRRAGAPDEKVDEIVITKLQTQMVSVLRQAIDELEAVDCAQKPGLAARVNSELAWLRATIQTFGGQNA